MLIEISQMCAALKAYGLLEARQVRHVGDILFLILPLDAKGEGPMKAYTITGNIDA